MKKIIFTVLLMVGTISMSGQTFNKYVPQKPVKLMYQVGMSFEKRNLVARFNELWWKIDAKKWRAVKGFNTEYNSFIKGGMYYYDAEDYNYMVLQMNNDYYLFSNVPGEIWFGLVEANSKGTFYHNYIRGRYLILSTYLSY